jgi:carotenoid 1,2-hydratase
MSAERPDFTRPVTPGGYAWWYLDALSDDGRSGITVIAFIGSVFSPYYAWARHRAARTRRPSAPENHVAMNAVLYGPRGKRWAMTERGAGALARSPERLSIGASRWNWQRGSLEIRIRERCAPWPMPLVGVIEVRPEAWQREAFSLDREGRHHWHPYAPRARVAVRFEAPRLAWNGDGYLDSNWGSSPLTRAFRRWHWCRLAGPEHTDIVYAVTDRQGEERLLGLRTRGDGLEDVPPPPPAPLPVTAWGIERPARGVRLERTLENTPFYARSQVTGAGAVPRRGVHEALDVARLGSLWVNCLLPFRMPRLGPGGVSRPGP